MEGGTQQTCKMVATPASAHLPHAEGYTDTAQRSTKKEARTDRRTEVYPHRTAALADSRGRLHPVDTRKLPPDMPVLTERHG